MIKHSTISYKGLNDRPRWVKNPANKLYISEDLHGWIPRFSDFKHSKNQKKLSPNSILLYGSKNS